MVKQKEEKNSKKNVNGASEEMEEEKKQKEEDNSLDTFNRVTGSLSGLSLISLLNITYLKIFLTNNLKKNQIVSFKDCNYVFTVSDDKIYGIKRANEVNKSSDSI